MSKTAFIFPGQGVQHVGMGKDFYENSRSAQDVFESASETFEKDMAKLCFESSEEELKQTINAQPAILVTSIAAMETFKEKCDISADYFAGHSLGEYAALYASWVLDLDDALEIVHERATLMSTSPKGSMAAVLGLSADKIKETLLTVRNSGVIAIANYNAPEQTVITGNIEAIEKSVDILKKAGAKKVIPLAVSGPFHSPLMKDAALKFKEFLTDYDINDANCPVVTNCDAKITIKGKEFEKKMVEQIYSSVYWYQSVNKMVDEGVDTFVEFGPGKVLTGLIKKINPDVKVYNISDMKSLDETVNSLS